MTQANVNKLKRLLLKRQMSATLLINHFFTTCDKAERGDFVKAYEILGKAGTLRPELLSEVLYETSLRDEAIAIAAPLVERKKYMKDALKVLAFHAAIVEAPSKKVVTLVSEHLAKQVEHHVSLPSKRDSEDLADSLNFVLNGLQMATPISKGSVIHAQIKKLSKEKKAHALVKKIAKRILRGERQWVKEAGGK